MAEPDQADASAVAPPVVAVVVTCDAGPWLEPTLRALGRQDYPNLSVLVVDAGGREDPTARVAAVLPQAYVRRMPQQVGFGEACNEVLELVEGASLYLFCHDDVAPDEDAVRQLVEEAFRSNAGIVAPKVVEWDSPERLLQVGLSADKTGVPSPLAERGELDQEQHDAVRDVFWAPGGCTLVRADLFATIGGFDTEMGLYGEDLDLSWRAQVAGARVVVAPAARVRHVEALTSGLRDGGTALSMRDELRPLQLRHRLRAVLKNYGIVHLVRVVPQLLVLNVAEVVYGLITGRRTTAAAIVGAWTWNLRRHADLRARRKQVRRTRAMSDTEVRRLQVRGSARFSAFIRGQIGGDERTRLLTVAGRDLSASFRDMRLPLLVWAVITAVLLVGSRSLLTGRLPTLGEIVPFPEGPGTFLREFVSGWRTTGLGAEGSAPAAFGFLGLAGVVLLGAMGLLQKLLVLGMMPVGIWGATRLARPLDSPRARLVAGVIYAANPLAYNALARGRWSGLLAYGAAPFILARLLRATGLEPFGRRVLDPEVDDEEPSLEPEEAHEPVAVPVVRRLPPLLPLDPIGPELDWTTPVVAERDEPEEHVPLWARPGRPVRWRLPDHALPLGVLLAVVAALVPAMAPVTLLMAVGLFLGGLLGGSAPAMARAVAVAAGALAVAAVLLFPWTLEFVLPGANWATFTGIDLPAARGLGLGALMRFETGPVGGAPLGWAIVVAATLPLVIGRDWRFSWAARLWTLAVTCWVVVWLGGRDIVPVPLPSPEVLLAPAAAALALAVAFGVLAFEVDLSGFRFGIRQLAPAAAAAAVVVAVVPLLGASVDGRWNLPDEDVGGLLSWMPAQQRNGAFRVLWVGDPEGLPLQGWRLGPGLAYGTSRNGPPDATTLWPGSSDGATELIADAVNLARGGRTTTLGHLLAPMAIRYVVVPGGGVAGTAAPPVADALGAQVDLRELQGDAALVVYENAAWAPARARLGQDAAEASRASGLVSARNAELAGSEPVLPKVHTHFRMTGPLTDGDQVLLSEASSPRWQLSVGGRRADRRTAFGWANAFEVGRGGNATLRYRTSPARYVAIAVELALWFAALRSLRDHRRRVRAEQA